MEIFEFEGFWKCESKCGVTIKKQDEKITVILTELDDNPGTSITNAYEEIATKLHNEQLQHVDPTSIRWIEHYSSKRYGETFDEVSLHWDGRKYSSPVWTRLKDDVFEL